MREWPGPASSWRSPSRARSGSSTTCTAECAAAAASTSRTGRPASRSRRCPIGPQLRALAVYLVVYQHVPVERCPELIAGATGARVWDGFIHSCLRKAAGLLAGVIKLIKTLITAAHVAGFDETTLRCGPAGQKMYVHGGVHRAALAVLPRRPQPGIEARLRHIAVVRRRRGLRPVRELLLQGLGAHRRAPGLPGPHPARLPARRRDLPGRDRAGPGAAGAARPDRRLARRPRRRPARDPRRRRGPADPGIPPRGPRRAGHRSPHPRPEARHRPAPRP